jgi:hypothetical protein
VSADKGAQHLNDGASVLGGVLHQRLKRVDAAKPDSQLVFALLAELFNSLYEPVGSLALEGEILLLSGALTLQVKLITIEAVCEV